MARSKVRVRELAEYLGVSTHTIYRRVARGEIPFERLGGGQTSLIFDLDDIEALLRAHGSAGVGLGKTATVREGR